MLITGAAALFTQRTYEVGCDATEINPGEVAAERLPTALGSTSLPWPHQFDLSSNDLWLATPLKDRETTNLYKISTRDGTLHQIMDFQQRSTMIARQVSWSKDNKYIFAALLETDADIVLLDGALR